MKIKNTIYLIAVMALAACSADEFDMQLSPEQKALIGQGVSFSASMADRFVTRTTYHHDGSFNEGDQMRIFRQYANTDGTTFDEDNEIFRTYYYKMNYAAGTSVSLNNDWLPAPESLGKKLKTDEGKIETQTSADSLTWENGRTVRFRAWGRSNLSGALSAEKKADARNSYYSDYTVSDWVTVSGPTQNIPLTMRHIACRIALTCKAGNEFGSAQVCLDDADYENAEDAAKVRAVYSKMCMPAGVDDKTFLLTAMTQDLYSNDNTDFNNIEQCTEGIVKIGTLEADDIAKKVQHPLFKNNNGNQYLMTIPFDMSKGSAGEALVLPACTRFKVWLYYVNGSNKHETACHIFELGKIKNEKGNDAFPDGLTLKAGYSYSFSVGYQYNALIVTTTNNFSWEEKDMGDKDATNKTVTKDDAEYGWWTSAIASAAKVAIGGKDYIPSFSIATEKEFLAFINLVNGTAAKEAGVLKRGDVRIENGDTVKVDGFPTYMWKKKNEQGDTVEITRDAAEADGYVFYHHFHASDVNQKAYVSEEYVTGPLDFYDANFHNRYVVKLADDLDFNDWELSSIGDSENNKAFRGQFKGEGHLIKNLNMKNGYLFDYVKDGAITNLKIESSHKTCLLNKAEFSDKSGWGCYIAGISMLCPSPGSSIAASLKGTSYVVGCIHVGSAEGALVGTVDSNYALTMLGCMQAASGLNKTTGALLGCSSVKWGTFKYNYYDIDLSVNATAVAGVDDSYDYDDYIRGGKSYVLKAKNDYMIGKDVDKKKLNADMLKVMYGMAPWSAMNKGIEEYNSTPVGVSYPCNLRYNQSTVGYTNRYPTLQ